MVQAELMFLSAQPVVSALRLPLPGDLDLPPRASMGTPAPARLSRRSTSGRAWSSWVLAATLTGARTLSWAEAQAFQTCIAP